MKEVTGMYFEMCCYRMLDIIYIVANYKMCV